MNGNMLFQGKAGRASMTRIFSYSTSKLELAQGFVKLEKSGHGKDAEVRFRVIDKYGHHTAEEEKYFLERGYILMGYKSKLYDEQGNRLSLVDTENKG